MKKDAVIQIRISKTDKENLKMLAYYAYMSTSKFITNYLDSIVESGCIEEFRIQKNYGIPLSKEELKDIVGGAAIALEKDDYNLALKILTKIKTAKLIRENKDQYLNIRYSSDKKEKLDKIIKDYDTSISEVISRYIYADIDEYGELFKPLTDNEILERQKKAEADIKAGRIYTTEEVDEMFEKIYGADFINGV